MTGVNRRRRIAYGAWILIAVVVWNGLYDLRITLGVRDYLLKQALHEAGQAPAVVISEAMRVTVRDALAVATLWASIILAAGVWTVRTLTRPAASTAGSS